MIRPILRAILKTVVILFAACTPAAQAGDWTGPVVVRHELKPCVTYRAQLSGPFLVIQASLEPGWHTFTMDNKQRAAEKLAGKKSLGIDQPTEIALSEGLEAAGPWHQSPPKDFSKPELRWYSWGFEERALFVAKVRRSGTGPARIVVRGQACTESTCKNIDVELSVPLPAKLDTAKPDIDLQTLIQVR
jgi:hypothetical protein